MRFLRSASGQTLISSPFDGLRIQSQNTGTERIERPRVELSGSLATPVQHCRFFCQWCGEAILMPHDKLGMPFASPFLRKIEARSIATVCRACSHVAGFSLFRGCYGYDTRNNLVQSQPSGHTAFLGWLPCEEPTCAFPLPLFVTTEDELDGARAKELASSWLWNDLTCTASHKIKSPLWIYDQRPYHLPQLLK